MTFDLCDFCIGSKTYCTWSKISPFISGLSNFVSGPGKFVRLIPSPAAEPLESRDASWQCIWPQHGYFPGPATGWSQCPPLNSNVEDGYCHPHTSCNFSLNTVVFTCCLWLVCKAAFCRLETAAPSKMAFILVFSSVISTENLLASV